MAALLPDPEGVGGRLQARAALRHGDARWPRRLRQAGPALGPGRGGRDRLRRRLDNQEAKRKKLASHQERSQSRGREPFPRASASVSRHTANSTSTMDCSACGPSSLGVRSAVCRPVEPIIKGSTASGQAAHDGVRYDASVLETGSEVQKSSSDGSTLTSPRITSSRECEARGRRVYSMDATFVTGTARMVSRSEHGAR